jgi:hypothetical protein
MDIEELIEQLEALARDTEALVDGLSPEQGTQAPAPGAWSVSECLDHLATGNRVYLRAMEEPARRAREGGRWRRRPAKPGWAGRLFVAMLEPPPKWWSRMKAPRKIRPRIAPPLADTFAAFMASQRDMLAFLRENADLDLASIGFPNPFIPGIRFSLATGLHVTVAHEKRHLLQARRARTRVLSTNADTRLGR